MSKTTEANNDESDIRTDPKYEDAIQTLCDIFDSPIGSDDKTKDDKSTIQNNCSNNKTNVLQDELCLSEKTLQQRDDREGANAIFNDKCHGSDQLDSGQVLRMKKKTSDVGETDKSKRIGYVNISTEDEPLDISLRKGLERKINNKESHLSCDDDKQSKGHDDVDASRLRRHKDHPRPTTLYTRSYRDSIIYTYETFCGEGGEACDIDQCCPEFTNTANNKDRKSSIEFMVDKDYTELGGMNLFSSRGSHFIEITEPDNNYSSRMSLRTSDKLLAINNLAVEHYQHNIILELLRYLVHSSIEEKTSLLVERQDQNGDTEILEIKVQAEITECEETPMVKIKTEVCYSRIYNLGITCVKLQNKFNCKVNITGTNLYVVADKKRLHVRTLHHGDKKKGTFTCYEFSGLCMDRRGHEPNPIFIGVFQSCENDKYIMASSKSRLSLVTAGNINTSMDKIFNADARFFIVSKTGSGQSFFESLLYPGSYWMTKGKDLELQTDSTRNVLRKQNAQFDLIPF